MEVSEESLRRLEHGRTIRALLELLNITSVTEQQ
jgi:hypothetical protein